MRTRQLQKSSIFFTTLALSLGIVGCAGCGPGGPLEVSWADTAGSCSELYNFSWVLEDQLAGMARPGTSHPLDEELAALQACDITLLVSLTTTPTPVDPAVAPDLELLHLPVADFTAPTQEQLQTFVQRARAVIAGGHAAGVHCAAGKGRTGTFLAVYMVSQGMTAEEAIDHIRALRPGSIETQAQEQAVKLFYKELMTTGSSAE